MQNSRWLLSQLNTESSYDIAIPLLGTYLKNWKPNIQGRQHIKKQRHYFANKCSSSQGSGWTVKKAECRRMDAFELWCWRRLLSLLDCKEIQVVNPKGNQSWIFTGGTDAEAEGAILWPSDVKNWLIGKDPDAGKDWKEEKGMTEDEMVGWHHRLNGHEFEQVLGLGDG